MEIYDVIQLGKMLHVAPKTVRSYLIKGILKGRKVGKRWLVAEDAVRQFLMETINGAGDSLRDLIGPFPHSAGRDRKP